MNIAIWIFTVIATFCFMEFIAWFSHKYIMHGFMWFLHKDHHKKDHKSWFERNDMFFLQYAAVSMFFTVLWGEYNFWLGLPIAIGRPSQKSYSPQRTVKNILIAAYCRKNISFLSNQES